MLWRKEGSSITTISFDGETLAYDGRMTGHHIVNERTEKARKIKTENGYIVVAGAGSYSDLLAFFEWVENGMDVDDYPFSPNGALNVEAIVVTNDGQVFGFEDRPIPLPFDAPCALGSGSHIALGAMAAGATAKEAVKIAAKYDPATNNRVKTLKVVPKTAQKSVKGQK